MSANNPPDAAVKQRAADSIADAIAVIALSLNHNPISGMAYIATIEDDRRGSVIAALGTIAHRLLVENYPDPRIALSDLAIDITARIETARR